MKPGTHKTTVFQPTLTYTVPAGWSNFEDTPGNFLLAPPHSTLTGVNAQTSDFIGIYNVAAPNGCQDGPAPGVDVNYAGMLGWLEHDHAVALSNTHRVSIGGLHGTVTDVRIAPTWKKACPYSNGNPVAPLITGASPSGLDHNVGPGNATRLYLFDLGPARAALCVEVSDVHDAHHLDSYSKVVNRIKFG